MIRKLVLSAAVALLPGFALAAATGTAAPAASETHATAVEAKTDAAVKSDAKDAAVKTDVKSDGAVKSKAVTHRANKAAGKGKTDTKSDKGTSSNKS